MASKQTQQSPANLAAEFTCSALLIVSAILIGTLGFFSGFRWLALILGILGYGIFWGIITDIAKRHNFEDLASEYSIAISVILCIVFSIKLTNLNWIPLIILILLYAFVNNPDRRYYLNFVVGVVGVAFSIVGWQILNTERIWLFAIACLAPTFLTLQRGSMWLKIFIRLIIGIIMTLLGLILLYNNPVNFLLQLALGVVGAITIFGCIPLAGGFWSQWIRTPSSIPWYLFGISILLIQFSIFPTFFFLFHKMIIQYGLFSFFTYLLCVIAAYSVTVLIRQSLTLIQSEYQGAKIWFKYFISGKKA